MLHSPDQGPTSSDPFWVKILGLAAVLVLFGVGMWNYPIAMLGTDRSLIPGDLTEARSNNYILEHFHSFITGKVDDYWDAPFMHPTRNALAYSEDLIGTAPFYSILRSTGYNRETSFQAWIVLLFALNFWCCFLALRIWCGHSIASAAGAFIFAFGIFSLGQIQHLQMLPRFASPFAMVFAWRYLDTRKPLFLFLAAFATIYQFYCALQLGFVLLWGLLFLVVGYLIAYRRQLGVRPLKGSIPLLVTCVISIIALVPLAIPRLSLPDLSISARSTFDLAPLSSYWSSHPAAVSWHDLSVHGGPQLFPGAICIAAILISLTLVVTRRRDPSTKKFSAILLALLLHFVFSIVISSSEVFAQFTRVPVNSLMTSPERVAGIQILFFSMAFVALPALLPSRRWITLSMIIVLPALVLIDNKIDVRHIPTFNKWTSRNLVAEVERHITVTGYEKDAIIAYTPLLPILEEEQQSDRVSEIHISTMLATQQLGIPTVNGHARTIPSEYMDFFERLDERSLLNWCERSGCDPRSIVQVTNAPFPVASTDTVILAAADGRMVYADTIHHALLISDSPRTDLSATFLLIRATDDRIALLAHNGNFVCAELLQRSQVSATAPDLGDFGIFEQVELDQGSIALRAHNGSFVTVNDKGSLYAVADSVGKNERFRFVEHVR